MSLKWKMVRDIFTGGLWTELWERQWEIALWRRCVTKQQTAIHIISFAILFVVIKYIFIWKRFLLDIEAMVLYVFALKTQPIYSCKALLITRYTTRCNNTQYHNLNFHYSQKNKYQALVKIVGKLNPGKKLTFACSFSAKLLYQKTLYIKKI